MNTLILHDIHVFLASSKELEEDRREITELIAQLNETVYEPAGIRIKLDKWERQDPAFKGERTQEEYDKLVRNSKLFIALFHHWAGTYTLEEFNIARDTCINNQGFPNICIYYKALEQKEKEDQSLTDFKKEVAEKMEYFTPPPYAHIDTLRYSIMMQLYHLCNNHSLKAEIKNSRLMIGNLCIGNLDNISFSGNNAEVIRLKQEIEETSTAIEKQQTAIVRTQGRIDRLRQRIASFKEKNEYDEVAEREEELIEKEEELQERQDEHTQLQIKRNHLTSRLEEHNNRLLDIALQINQLPHQKTSKLLQQASILFEQGDSQGAAALLNYQDIEPDINRSLQKYKQEEALLNASREALTTHIEVLLLSAKSTLADTKASHRFRKACKSREKVLEIARTCLPAEQHARYVYKYARFLDKNHKSEQALSYYRQAIQLYTPLLSTTQNGLTIQTIIARCHNLMGNIHNICGDFAEAEACYRQAFAMYLTLRKAIPDGNYDCKLLLVQSNLGVLYFRKGDKEKGQNYIEKAVEQYEQMVESKKQKYRPDIAQCWINLGCFYKDDTRKHRNARVYLSKALECYMQLCEQDNQRYSAEVAKCHHNLGNLRTDNDWAESESSLLKALEIRKKLAQEKPEIYLPEVASTQSSLGRYYQFQAQKVEIGNDNRKTNMVATELKEKAIFHYLQSVRIRLILEKEELRDTGKKWGIYTQQIGDTLHFLGDLYLETQQYQEATRHYLQSIEYYRNMTGKNKAYFYHVIQIEKRVGIIHEIIFNDLQEAQNRYNLALNLAEQYFESQMQIITDLRQRIKEIQDKQVKISPLLSIGLKSKDM